MQTSASSFRSVATGPVRQDVLCDWCSEAQTPVWCSAEFLLSLFLSHQRRNLLLILMQPRSKSVSATITLWIVPSKEKCSWLKRRWLYNVSGLREPEWEGEDKEDRPAAHVIGDTKIHMKELIWLCAMWKKWQTYSLLAGRIEKEKFVKTLRWEARVGRAYTSGGVTYQFEDGALRVNESGLYHVYARVELIFKDCSPTSSFIHSVFVRRAERSAPLTLMEAHRAGFCSQQLGNPWTAESYLGATLQLQEHDRVYVNISHPTYLSHSHYANFFGLYKIWRAVMWYLSPFVVLLQW